MDAESFRAIEKFMLDSMSDDTAHDTDHVYRVLYGALLIASDFDNVDYDCLIASCLLHDIGRPKQMKNSKVCHAEAGAEMAKEFLLSNGYSESFAKHVSECIKTHRFRKGLVPETLEAKILFDADKFDVTGAIGIARTLAYNGLRGKPLYDTGFRGEISENIIDSSDSFTREYKFKLEGMYEHFYTNCGRELAADRRKAAEDFYAAMMNELNGVTLCGRLLLNEKIN